MNVNLITGCLFVAVFVVTAWVLTDSWAQWDTPILRSARRKLRGEEDGE